MATEIKNPYVGPRTFEEKDAGLFFGREREARELLSLVIAEPLVLFYAQSGAGKSSLINTRLIPGLRAEEFQVLPVGRVSGELPQGMTEVGNIFVFNLLLSLAQGRQLPATLAQTALTDFLQADRASLPPAPSGERLARVLIIDQFEEILTTHLDHWPERETFRQLNQAVKDDPLLWVVLSMREDYVAALDPYARLLQGKLRQRLYMQRMSRQSALEAVRQPAEQGRRPFASGVAEALVENLTQVRVPGETGTHAGEFVEPVQLQVVCYQLWENLKDRPAAAITYEDMQQLGDVDTALAQYYEQSLARVLQQTDVSEIDLRSWFETRLITEAGTRGTVYQGATTTAGLANQVVAVLARQYLLRAEIRAGGSWYELVHDRFIPPILKANGQWRTRQPLIQLALAWDEADRAPAMLLQGEQLDRALPANWQSLGDLVTAFVTAGRNAEVEREKNRQVEEEALRRRELESARQLAAEAEARRKAEAEQAREAEARAREQTEAAAKLRRRAVLLTGLGLVALILALTAGVLGWQSRQNALIAGRERQAAVANAGTAQAASTQAIASKGTALADRATALAAKEMAGQALTDLAANLQAQLAVQAYETSVIPPTDLPTATLTPTPAQRETERPAQTGASEAPPSEPALPTRGAVLAIPTIPPPAAPILTPTPLPTATPLPTEALMASQSQSRDLQAQLVQVQAQLTAIAPDSSLLFATARVVSFGGAKGDYLLQDPYNEKSGVIFVTVGTILTIVGQGEGSDSYGSGRWYEVLIPASPGESASVSGWLPVEVVQVDEPPTATATPRPVPTATATATPKPKPTAIPAGMVFVPAGAFLMGSSADSTGLSGLDRNPEPERDEFPQRSVYLPGFWIDRTEVSNADYRACITAGVCPAQRAGDANYQTNPVFDNYPVTFVAWENAVTYCRWMRKRLPTEAEWEKAARGTDGRIWPWGNALKDDFSAPVQRANVGDSETGGLRAVDAYPKGASPYGALNMTGNVWEWTNDWYKYSYYAERPDPDRSPPGPTEADSTGRKVIRGGNYLTPGIDARTAERNAVSLDPAFDIGFRCVK